MHTYMQLITSVCIRFFFSLTEIKWYMYSKSEISRGTHFVKIKKTTQLKNDEIFIKFLNMLIYMYKCMCTHRHKSSCHE